jgi:hypothetical protein
MLLVYTARDGELHMYIADSIFFSIALLVAASLALYNVYLMIIALTRWTDVQISAVLAGASIMLLAIPAAFTTYAAYTCVIRSAPYPELCLRHAPPGVDYFWR